jgi:hypothetical protein
MCLCQTQEATLKETSSQSIRCRMEDALKDKDTEERTERPLNKDSVKEIQEIENRAPLTTQSWR